MSRTATNLTDRVFGSLTVLRRRFPSKRGPSRAYATWAVKCVCGKEFSVIGSNLVSKRTTSCGCQRKKAIETIVGE